MLSESAALESGIWKVALSGFWNFLRREKGDRKLRRRPDDDEIVDTFGVQILLGVWPIWKWNNHNW